MKKNKISRRRLEFLVEQNLEGNLTSGEEKELESLLSSSEEARIYAMQMQALHESLLKEGAARPSIDLTAEVMEKIKKAGIKPENSQIVPLYGHLRLIHKEVFKYAAIFIAGLILGSALTFLIFPEVSPLRNQDLSAAISARAGQEVNFRGDDWQIQIQPVSVSDMIDLVMQVQTTAPLDINLYFEEKIYSLESVRFLRYDVLPKSESQGGLVSLQVSGDLVAQFLFVRQRGIKQSFTLEVLQEGKSIFTRKVFMP